MPGLTQGDFQEKAFKLGTMFKPAAPINSQDLFAGRQDQIRDVVDAITQQGQHAVIYGERGVGKTSLANMIFPNLRASDAPIIAPQINCMTPDSFSSIWKRVFEEISFVAKENDADLDKPIKRILAEYTAQFSDEVSPDVVRRLLHHLGQDRYIIIILDEFDTIESDDTRATMSDTLKFLSDRAVPATVILIGVADDVENLVKNHRSLERCLKQIPTPRMSDSEMAAILQKGLERVDMSIEKDALIEISRLARGLPHYAHLLGLHAGRASLDDESLNVAKNHVQIAVAEAVSKAQASIRSDYLKATTSSREEALYRHVLLASAVAETDDLGWFYPKDVRGPLSKILGRQAKIESFARHLHAFCETERGPVLIKDESSARPRFRFENPLVQPYVLIRGLADNLLNPDDLIVLKETRRLPGEQKSLFD